MGTGNRSWSLGTGEFNAAGNPAMDWHPIKGGGERGSRNIPSRFMIQNPG